MVSNHIVDHIIDRVCYLLSSQEQPWLLHHYLQLFAAEMCNKGGALGPVHPGADPFGSGPTLERIGLACTRDLLYLIQFGSAIRTSLGRIE